MHRDFVMKTVSIALLLLIAVNGVVSAENLARGWGDSVAWRTLDAGSVEAAETGKPLMLLIHKSWCGACKSLKPKLASSDEFAELSKYFVMDDEEPDDAAYAPDGRYIPRILFADSNGAVVESIFNKAGSPKYKYYYSDASLVVDSMHDAIKHFKL